MLLKIKIIIYIICILYNNKIKIMTNNQGW